MSRALTIYTRRDKAEGPTPEVERVMAEQGCSEPVARNLLKYAKLGIGPLAGAGASRDADRRPFRERETSREREMRRNMPPKQDPKVAAALAEQRLREKEEQEEKELEEKRKQDVARRRVGLSRLGPVLARDDDPNRPAAFLMPGRAEEEAGDQDDKKSRPRHGLRPLGPVLARQEEVDPLLSAPPPPPPPPEPQGEPPEDDDDNAGVALGTHRTRSAERKRVQAQQEEARRAKKKKRRRGKDEKSGDSDALQNEIGHVKKAALERPQEVKRGIEPAVRQEKARSPSASPAPDTGRGAGSSGGLMSEAQVLAMMNKEGKTKRGSVRAMSRIQREMQEWETRKQQNPEFWKAPQFALCYSAETGNKRSAY